MIKIIAVLCSLSSPANCREQLVTSSDFADVTMQSCVVGAPQLADWMKRSLGHKQPFRTFCEIPKHVLFRTRPGMAESEVHKDHRGAVFLLCEWPCFG